MCLVCDEDVVEDEFHFLCICNRYNDIRESLYKKADSRNISFASLSNEDKFMYLMKFENVEVANFSLEHTKLEKVNCTALNIYNYFFLSTCIAIACSLCTNI